MSWHRVKGEWIFVIGATLLGIYTGALAQMDYGIVSSAMRDHIITGHPDYMSRAEMATSFGVVLTIVLGVLGGAYKTASARLDRQDEAYRHLESQVSSIRETQSSFSSEVHSRFTSMELRVTAISTEEQHQMQNMMDLVRSQTEFLKEELTRLRG